MKSFLERIAKGRSNISSRLGRGLRSGHTTIAVDGGAFQQGIGAGILNVIVGLLNTLSAEHPRYEFVLVADPRLGDVQEQHLQKLTRRPDIIRAEVGPAYHAAPHPPTTEEAHPIFEIDGRQAPAVREGDTLVYEGPPPKASFVIASRAARPSQTLGSPDGRRLGLAVSSIELRTGAIHRPISIHDPRISEGFWPAEPDRRWTNGRGVLPVSLFEGCEEHVRVEVSTNATTRYGLANGLLDKAYVQTMSRISRSELVCETLRLESELHAIGARAYLANHFIPARFTSLPTFSILYDLIPVLFPSFFNADAKENFGANMEVFRTSEHVFAISERSKNDLVQAANVDPDRVTVIPLDASSVFQPVDAPTCHPVLEKFRLSRPFILSVGTVEPRKNHRRLVEAVARAAELGLVDCDIVVVGKMGWGYEGLTQTVDRLGLASRFKFLDDVADTELAALYSSALFLVYPSLYEGFGLPVLEAMACNCAVVTSEGSSMAELAGDAAFLVEPTNVEAIARALTVMASDPALRESLKARGRSRREAYAWAKAAHRIAAVWDATLEATH